MELASNVAYFLEEAGLDVHVNVFVFVRPRKTIGLNFFKDGFKASDNGIAFNFGQYSAVAQHTGVGAGAGNVLFGQASVE